MHRARINDSFDGKCIFFQCVDYSLFTNFNHPKNELYRSNCLQVDANGFPYLKFKDFDDVFEHSKNSTFLKIYMLAMEFR